MLLVGSAFIFFALLTNLLIRKNQNKKIIKKIKSIVGIKNTKVFKSISVDGIAFRVLNDLLKTSYLVNTKDKDFYYITKFIKSNDLPQKYKNLCRKCDMPSSFGNYALRICQLKYMLLFSMVFSIVGCVFSLLMMWILLTCGLILGYRLPLISLKKEKDKRTQNIEKYLPDMLDVVSLGLRSGLSFDRSFELYYKHFKNEFSKSCQKAQEKWDNGLISREDSLRQLSSSYDCYMFSNIIENVIRSIRFGTSLVSYFEEAAIDSRELFKERQEEIVSKAPVKMMIPTGTLILPAMLILILGPILLELFKGF